MTRSYKLLAAHAVIMTLFMIVVVLFFQWYTLLTEFTGPDFRTGASLIRYDKTVMAGGEMTTVRRVKAEPQGCQVIIRRYVSPLTDLNQELFIGLYERTSKPIGYIDEQKVLIPVSIPPGHYIYRGQANYYCSWVNYVFGPIKTHSIPIELIITPYKDFT